MKICTTKLVQKIVGTKGRFFGIEFYTENGKYRKYNAQYPRPSAAKLAKDKVHGQVTIRNTRSGRYKTVNTKKIIRASVDGEVLENREVKK